MIVVALALVAVVVAEYEKPIGIVRSSNEQQADGSFAFGYESEDGPKRQETGEVKEVLNEENKPQKVVVVRGEYSYPDKEGKPVRVNYYADESGYHAEGDTIPKSPEV